MIIDGDDVFPRHTSDVMSVVRDTFVVYCSTGTEGGYNYRPALAETAVARPALELAMRQEGRGLTARLGARRVSIVSNSFSRSLFQEEISLRNTSDCGVEAPKMVPCRYIS